MEQQLTLFNQDRDNQNGLCSVVNLNLPDAQVLLYEEFFDSQRSDRDFNQLLSEIHWQQDSMPIYDKLVPLPRLTSWYGDPNTTYTYSGIEMQPHPWTETLLEIKSRVEEQVCVSFNSVLLNLYRTGQDSVSWHSDNEAELSQCPVIASLSLGATRRFSLKHKWRNDLKPIHLELQSGTLLLMGGTTQRNWLHQVPKTTKPVGQRINLTFRVIG